MIFPAYFAPEAIELPKTKMTEVQNIDYQIERCTSCKPQMLMKNGNVRDLDQKTFNKLLKRWRHMYAHQGTVM